MVVGGMLPVADRGNLLRAEIDDAVDRVIAGMDEMGEALNR